MNVAPAGFAIERDLPAGFAEFYLPLHRHFTPLQQRLVKTRGERLARAHAGELPNYFRRRRRRARVAHRAARVVPDQRNQMTDPRTKRSSSSRCSTPARRA